MSARGNSFILVKGENYLALPRNPIPWVVEKLLPSSGLLVIGGEAKQGKSYLSLGLAIAVANPEVQTFLGRPVLQHGPVIYLQVDTPREEWAERIERVKSAGIDNIYFTDANLVPYPCVVTDPATKHDLAARIKEVKPVAIVIDTLREVHQNEENDATEMLKVITSLVEITKAENTALVLVMHTRKTPQKKKGDEYETDPINDIRGSNYVVGRADVISVLENGRYHLAGRSLGRGAIQLEMDKENFLWHLKEGTQSENAAAVKTVMSIPELRTEKDRIDMLKSMTKLGEKECAQLLRDWKPR